MTLQLASFVLVNIAVFVVCEVVIITHIHHFFKNWFLPRRDFLNHQEAAISMLLKALEPVAVSSPSIVNVITTQFTESIDGSDPLETAVRYLRWTSFLRCTAGVLAIALPPAWTMWLFSVIGLV
jgi:hypothetical protein